MKRFWMRKGFIMVFIVTVGLTLVSMYSCKKKYNNTKAPIFDEQRSASVDVQKGLQDTGFYYQDDTTTGDSRDGYGLEEHH